MHRSGYKYDYQESAPVPEGSSYAHALSWIEPKTRILDIGSGPGHLAGALSAQGCRVTCIELDAEAAERARAHAHEVHMLDIGVAGWAASIADRFDFAVLLDVLEHLPDPAGVLDEVLGLLAPGGQVIISVPNVAHATVRLPLFLGEWRYEREGILDDTHLKFYSLEGLGALLYEAGLSSSRVERVMRIPKPDLIHRFCSEVPIDPDELNGLLGRTEGFTWQYVVLTHIGRGDDTPPEAYPSTVQLSQDLMQQVSYQNRELERLRRIEHTVEPLLRIRRGLRQLIRFKR